MKVSITNSTNEKITFNVISKRDYIYTFIKHSILKIPEGEKISILCLICQIILYPSHILLLFGEQKGYNIQYNIRTDSIVLKGRVIPIEKLLLLLDKDLEAKLN